jgi:hypothetical protein
MRALQSRTCAATPSAGTSRRTVSGPVKGATCHDRASVSVTTDPLSSIGLGGTTWPASGSVASNYRKH